MEKSYCGTTTINGINYDVYCNKFNQFCIHLSDKFIKFIKESVLRKSGIYCTYVKIDDQGKPEYKTKKVFGKHGYIGFSK